MAEEGATERAGQARHRTGLKGGSRVGHVVRRLRLARQGGDGSQAVDIEVEYEYHAQLFRGHLTTKQTGPDGDIVCILLL